MGNGSEQDPGSDRPPAPSIWYAWAGEYPALIADEPGGKTGPGARDDGFTVKVPDISSPPPLSGWAVHVVGSTLHGGTSPATRGGTSRPVTTSRSNCLPTGSPRRAA